MLYFCLNVNMAITIEEEYNIPFNNKGKLLPLFRMTKKQEKEVVADIKVKMAFEQALLE